MNALERNRMVRLIESMNRNSELCRKMNIADESTFRGKRIITNDQEITSKKKNL